MPYNVLILDDDSDFNSLLTDIFEQADYVVTSLEDPLEAIEVFTDGDYDIVVTDYKMPEMTGADFMAEIQKIRPEIPVVMVSGFLENDTIRELIGDGIGGVFLKPLNIFSLLERTAELIQEAKKSSDSETSGSSDEEGDDELAVAQLGFPFQSFPCRSKVSADFAERLYSLRNFKSSISLIGEPGTHYRLITEDIRGFYGNAAEHFLYFDPDSFYASDVLSAIEGVRDAERITCVLLELEAMSLDQKKLAVSLSKQSAEFDSVADNVRVIFCVSGDLDILYDDGLIDENLYILMGTTEVRIPSLHASANDIPAIAQRLISRLCKRRRVTVAPKLDRSARDFLRSHRWKLNWSELEMIFVKLFDSGPYELITAGTLKSAIKSVEGLSLRSDLQNTLSSAHRDYVQSVNILFKGDRARVAEFFGTHQSSIDTILG